jgi:hypothetical protein
MFLAEACFQSFRINPIPGGYLKVPWMAALSLIRLQKEVKIASSRPE